MSSPAVWLDASMRIAAAAQAFELSVAWPNEAFSLPPDPIIWIAVEIMGESAAPIELGLGAWEETGEVILHVMTPVGTPIIGALNYRKALADAFRAQETLTAGLQYRSVRYDPLGAPADDGLYRPLSLAVLYSYQDR